MSEIYVRDRSSGRIHRNFRTPGVKTWASFEQCNLDAAGERDEITADELTNAEPGDLCRRCFPDHITVTNDEGA